MRMCKAARCVFIGLAVAVLGACSSVGSGDDASGNRAAVDDSVVSSGLGEQDGFGGQNGNFRPGTYSTKIETQTYYYAYDSYQVDSKYMESIRAQGQYLLSHPNARILLAGHSDERGSREYNIALGEHRSNSVYQVLVESMHVPKNQIRSVSYGQEHPAVEGHDESMWKWNRRVVLSYEAK